MAAASPMEWTHLVRSNAPPSLAEEANLMERLSSLDDHLMTVGSQLASAQRVFMELNAQHSQLHEKRAAFSSIISPLRRLPVDIIAEIISCAVWSSPRLVSDSTSDQCFFGLSENLNWGRFNNSGCASGSLLHDVGPWLQEKQLATLTRVCRDWRDVALSTPLLWNDLQLQVFNNDPPLDSFVPHLQTWFNRAQEVPLSFTVLFSKETRRDEPPAPGFSDFLHHNRVRWKNLRLNMPSLGSVLSLLLGPQTATNPPSDGEDVDQRQVDKSPAWAKLETLALSGWFTEDVDVDIFNMNGPNDGVAAPVSSSPSPALSVDLLPSLKSLTLYIPYRKIYDWDWIPWAQLHDLHLRSADTYESYVNFLERCEELRTCYLFFNPSLRIPILDSAPADGNTAVTPIRPIHLPRLEDLNLEINHIVPLVKKLVLPSLKTLSISQDMRLRFQAPESNVGQVLVDFFERSVAAVEPTLSADSPSDPSFPSSFSHSSIISSSTTAAAAAAAHLPTTFLNLNLHGFPTDIEPDYPRITTAEYLQIFEKLPALEGLHVKAGPTDAAFLNLVEERGLLPNLKTIQVEVGPDAEARRRFERFVEARANGAAKQ